MPTITALPILSVRIPHNFLESKITSLGHFIRVSNPHIVFMARLTATAAGIVICATASSGSLSGYNNMLVDIDAPCPDSHICPLLPLPFVWEPAEITVNSSGAISPSSLRRSSLLVESMVS